MECNVTMSIFGFAYYAALNDATMQAAYMGDKKNIAKNDKVRDIVREYIDAIINGEDPSFDNTAEAVKKAIHDEKFRFGNIQKLINMTVKYIYLGAYSNKDFHDRFKKCHCPMDRIMIKKVKQDYLEYCGGNDKEELLQIKIGEDKTSTDWSKVSWSRIDFNGENERSKSVYDNFQKMVRLIAEKKGISPIEYDFCEWGK